MNYNRTCIGCGNPFETTNYNKKRCNPECGRKRTTESKDGARKRKQDNHELEFIAVDGEGVNRHVLEVDYDDNGDEIEIRTPYHAYVLLSVGDQSLHKNGAELTHRDIFPFLWEQYLAHPNAVFVGFALGYDFTMWLRSLSYTAAFRLLHKKGIENRQRTLPGAPPFPVNDRSFLLNDDGTRVVVDAKWEFDILGTKRFKLRPYVKPEDVPTKTVQRADGTWETVKEPRPWMYICDVFPFFQSAFLKAIDPKTWQAGSAIVSQEEYDRIAHGKEHRQDAEFDEEMIEYNLLENEVLARLMSKMNEGFVSDNIRLNKMQWMGPGQAAQAWMRNIGVPTGEEVRDVVPKYALEAARCTYYGGWFEIFSHGPIPGTSYAYDINSAYPAVIATLPCLLHGKWTRGTGKPARLPNGAYRMVYGEFWGRDEWVGPLPFRHKSGSILRPMRVRGWYWWHEVSASKNAGLISGMRIEAWVQYEPCKCAPPMEAIRDLYNGRLRVDKNSPEGKAKKLVYNSAYGKCAQSIGNPKFSNAIYASLITAGCRTQILNAIATHPTKTQSLLMIATDGIVFKEPHPNLDVDAKRLGAWDAEEYENLSLMMPGLYWHDKARDDIRNGRNPALKSRGVNPKHLGGRIDYIDAQWKKYGWTEDEAFFIVEPKVSLLIPWALTGAKEAVSRDKWWTCGDIHYNVKREISGAIGSKRAGMCGEKHFGALRSYPYELPDGEYETTYYEPRFGDTEPMDESDMLILPEGTVSDLRAWAFGLR